MNDWLGEDEKTYLFFVVKQPEAAVTMVWYVRSMHPLKQLHKKFFTV